MAFKEPSGSFVHAAHFASLTLELCDHLFPGKRYFDLSGDQRRLLQNETQALLLQARWVVDSKAFADQFAIVQVGGQTTSFETPLGELVKTPPIQAPGAYT